MIYDDDEDDEIDWMRIDDFGTIIWYYDERSEKKRTSLKRYLSRLLKTGKVSFYPMRDPPDNQS